MDMKNGRLSGPQNALVRRLIKAGRRGIALDDVHSWTLAALEERGVATVRMGRVVLVAPTRTRGKGQTMQVLDRSAL
jgi:hypothetical protein